MHHDSHEYLHNVDVNYSLPFGLTPNGSYTLGKAPYMEASIGIENIFKFLRLDYVWRLNYRDHPGIQTKGVRFMMRMSF